MRRVFYCCVLAFFSLSLCMTGCSGPKYADSRRPIGSATSPDDLTGPVLADLTPSFDACMERCNEESELGALTREGCFSGCAEARRGSPYRDTAFASRQQCLDAVQRFDLNRDLQIEVFQAWCDTQWTHLHRITGCRDAMSVFFTTLTAANLCGSTPVSDGPLTEFSPAPPMALAPSPMPPQPSTAPATSAVVLPMPVPASPAPLATAVPAPVSASPVPVTPVPVTPVPAQTSDVAQQLRESVSVPLPSSRTPDGKAAGILMDTPKYRNARSGVPKKPASSPSAKKSSGVNTEKAQQPAAATPVEKDAPVPPELTPALKPHVQAPGSSVTSGPSGQAQTGSTATADTVEAAQKPTTGTASASTSGAQAATVPVQQAAPQERPRSAAAASAPGSALAASPASAAPVTVSPAATSATPPVAATATPPSAVSVTPPAPPRTTAPTLAAPGMAQPVVTAPAITVPVVTPPKVENVVPAPPVPVLPVVAPKTEAADADKAPVDRGVIPPVPAMTAKSYTSQPVITPQQPGEAGQSGQPGQTGQQLVPAAPPMGDTVVPLK